ncbi:sugar kinase [Microcoleus sp. FACHB-672]|uniref:sugar kinase n=1 Tax=Microcoleus sp. FACHB-672 TaxID=2692825 RepID=UPI001686C0AA|nr:sugar kinase [Microcoleus sp. FACHB-672]MBD2043258.1 sugar kinase [Microcoleus sp. FACHB-672]
MARHGLFVGLSTLDLVYLAASPPHNNQKIVASDYMAAAGGPATNAAITFSHLGNQATLLGVVGAHPIAQLIRADLESHGVKIADSDPKRIDPPAISSIIVTQSTGERAVVSINATQSQIAVEQLPTLDLENVSIILIDGHQMQISKVIAQEAQSKNIPIVVDGGSWKAGFEEILPLVNYVICSANFHPPNCCRPQEVFAYLQGLGIPHIAITYGEKSIQYFSLGEIGEVPVPAVKPVDTLGAGDIFHGAFCHYILQENFTNALTLSAKVASRSCQFFGTRQWMKEETQADIL